MITHRDQLTRFRKEIYSSFKKRRDALMNLLDALSSWGHQSRSVVQLSEAPCFERQYSSVTDGLADGLPSVNWQQITEVIFNTACEKSSAQASWCPTFILDCTGNPRPFARKLADRTINHSPNPAPSNRPIAVGHQYSCLALLPPDRQSAPRPWLVPLSMERVKSDEKGNEAGMRELITQLDKLNLTDRLTVSVGDSLYGTEACRITAASQPKLVHIFRVNSKRNVFSGSPIESCASGGRGRKKIYGDKMSLNKPSDHTCPNDTLQFVSESRQGKSHRMTIACWKNCLLRGSNNYDARAHPLSLLKITVTDTDDNPLFKRPLWLGVVGNERERLSLRAIYDYYISRYDIEHFFRLGKTRLLLDNYQTPDVTHEENWWRFSALAYNQLYFSRDLVPRLPKPWERYLPAYKFVENSRLPTTATAAQTQRGFGRLLKSLPRLATRCRPRGKPMGRLAGDCPLQRPNQPVIFKKTGIKSQDHASQPIIQGFEKSFSCSNPRKINHFVKFVSNQLIQFDISREKFTQILLDTG